VSSQYAKCKWWNEAAVIRKHCRDCRVPLFICSAEDTIEGRASTALNRGLPWFDMAISQSTMTFQIHGMKVMVTQNIATDLSITNGARGEIIDVVLYRDEPSS
ncbi:hypothetical protein NEOLEDRAFT_1060399, partial [Neolentinus lepideus HHB14362 ss-1]